MIRQFQLGQIKLIYIDVCNPHADALKIAVDRFAVQSTEHSNLGGIEINRKIPDDLSEFGFGNFRTLNILIFYVS